MNGAGGQGQTDQTANFFWLIVIIAGALIAFWWVDEKYIVGPIFWLRYYELEMIRLLAHGWAPVAKFLHITPPNIDRLDKLQQFVGSVDPAKVGWQDFAETNAFIGHWTRWPSIVLLLAGAVFMFFRYGTARFRQLYNMKTLRTVGMEVWPQITPVVSLDLAKIDIDTGPWAMAKPPLNFCRENDLLVVTIIDNKKIWALKHKQAYRLFVLQLGPMWKGLDNLPIHVKALVLVFLARATGKRPLSNKILAQIAASAGSGKLDFTGVSEELIAYRDHRIIKWLEKRHVYMTTLMASMLEIARSDGVLASSEFLWLKPVDRRLWFVLNTVGRRTAVVEVAGIYSHWVAEKKIGRGMKTPIVKGAVDALDETLKNILYVDEGDQWRTTSAD